MPIGTCYITYNERQCVSRVKKRKETKHMATAKEPTAAKAEKTTKAPQSAEDKKAQMAKAREARDSAAGKDRFVFLKENTDAKMAPQAKAIVEIVKSHGKDGVSRENLVKEMETGIGKDHAHKVATRQPMGRILAYYAKLITAETGICRLDKVSAAAPAAKAA